MGKRYLNFTEKQELIRLTTFYENIHDIAEIWSRLGKDKLLIKYLRMAKSLIDKVNYAITEDLDEDAKDSLLRYAKRLKVTIQHSDESKQAHKEAMKMEGVVPMRVDDLYDLVGEVSGEYCRLLCKKHGNKVNECRARQIMLAYDVPLANERAGDGECPYKL